MSPSVITISFLAALAGFYLLLMVHVARNQEGQERAGYFLIGYAFIAMALGIGEALQEGGQWQAGTNIFNDVQIYGAFILSVLMMATSLEFTRRDRSRWLIVALIWMIALVVIRTNIIGLNEVIWTDGNAVLLRDRLAPVLASLGWFIYTVSALASIRSTYTRSRQPLLRNRLNYFTPVFFLIFINDILLIAGREVPGNFLRLLAAGLAAFIITTHNPPDLRVIARRVLTYIITTLVIIGFYVAGFTASQRVFEAIPNFNPLLVGAGIALLLSFIFTPLLGAIRNLVNRWYNLEEIHATRTLHAYSQQISNILDMQKLANVAVGLITEAMDITRGFLFLVDTEQRKDGTKSFGIRAVRNPGEREIKVLPLDEESPIVKHFLQDQRPLLQYDLDLLPAYRPVTAPEREWFQHLDAEVYLPIFSKREWIGLLALGAKLSGNRYTESDLVTLATLANQTAVALENARLVENLIQLNNELRQAYRDLDKANRNLERLDRTKSDFISIASHELRTPLTTMIGYTEMLIEDESLPRTAHEMLNGISKGTRRLHEIVDSLFDIAQIDARVMQLHLVPVDLYSIARTVGDALDDAISGRKQSFKLDLSSAPVIKADPNLLEKLFHHLISNAIKFTPDGGSITVSARAVYDGTNTDLPSGGVEIIFSDTGVGVDPNARDLIFSKFYQPGDLTKHSTSKTRFKGGGTGLGLALSKGIVEAHGGQIWVESSGYDEEKFPGSHFHIILPNSRTDSPTPKIN